MAVPICITEASWLQSRARARRCVNAEKRAPAPAGMRRAIEGMDAQYSGDSYDGINEVWPCRVAQSRPPGCRVAQLVCWEMLLDILSGIVRLTASTHYIPSVWLPQLQLLVVSNWRSSHSTIISVNVL